MTNLNRERSIIAFRAGLAILLTAAIGEAQLAELPPAPGRLIDIGGCRLHVLCSGQGAPTVMLEAGASSFAIDWTFVQQEVSRTNRTCSYDRAGMGWSDPVPEGMRSSSATDLHTLMQKAGETRPGVLVGASRGGLLVRAYAGPSRGRRRICLRRSVDEDRSFTMIDGQALAIAEVTAEQLRGDGKNEGPRGFAGGIGRALQQFATLSL